MDRVDKVLLVLPLLPVADLLSTLFSLSLGGQEVGVVARPMLENYGIGGLVLLSTLASVTFFVFMGVVIRVKKLFVSEFSFRWMRYVLVVPIYWFFVLEGFYFSTVVFNLLVPFSPFLTQTIVLRAVLVGGYFVGVSAFTLSRMKQLPRF